MNEIEEMARVAMKNCEKNHKCHVCGYELHKPFCRISEEDAEALYNVGYRKVKPIIIKINDKVEVNCDTMEDYDKFLKETLKPIAQEVAKDVVNAGYIQLKTNGDYIRKCVAKSDDELANLCIAGSWNNNADKPRCISTITHCVYDKYEEAYKANLEWLKQEYKGE